MGIPMVEFLTSFDERKEEKEEEMVVEFDPSTPTRISRHPLQEDPYEKIHVYVATSAISPLAGEGLFAKRTLTKGHLICLFNGIRRIKKARSKAIGALDEEWSDYRLTLGKILIPLKTVVFITLLLPLSTFLSEAQPLMKFTLLLQIEILIWTYQTNTYRWTITKQL